MTSNPSIMWARNYSAPEGNEKAMEKARVGVAAALKVCEARKWPITKEPYYAIVSFGVVTAHFEFLRRQPDDMISVLGFVIEHDDQHFTFSGGVATPDGEIVRHKLPKAACIWDGSHGLGRMQMPRRIADENGYMRNRND